MEETPPHFVEVCIYEVKPDKTDHPRSQDLGRYYPAQSAAWLERQLSASYGSPRAVVLRKALTYLPPDLRRRLLESQP